MGENMTPLVELTMINVPNHCAETIHNFFNTEYELKWLLITYTLTKNTHIQTVKLGETIGSATHLARSLTQYRHFKDILLYHSSQLYRSQVTSAASRRSASEPSDAAVQSQLGIESERIKAETSHDKVDVDTLTWCDVYKMSLLPRCSPLTGSHSVRARMYEHVHVFRCLQLHKQTPSQSVTCSLYTMCPEIRAPHIFCISKWKTALNWT